MDRKIIMVNISQLKPHPENEKIYGTNEDTQALEKSILENGLRNHIKINENNIIISGHRRWQAYKNLVSKGHKEFCEIRCEILHFENAEDELECLVFENDTSTQRHKTIEQETRELMVYKEIEAIRAKKRMSLGGKGGIDNTTEGTPKLAYLEKGETREIIFKKYGDRYSIKSPRDVDNRIKSVEKADMLRKNGEKQKSDLIIGILNNNKTSQAYSLSNIIDQMSNDRINSIIDGNISVGIAIKETKSIKNDNKSMTSKHKNQLEEQQKSISKLVSEEMHNSKHFSEILISHLNEINRIILETKPFEYYPNELKSAIASTISGLKSNMKYIQGIFEMDSIPLIKAIMPICKLEFWKNLNYFINDKEEKCKITDEVIFTVLKSLALITDDDSYWMIENCDGLYDNYYYNVNAEMYYFAKKFDIKEDKKIIEHLGNIYNQFALIIQSMPDVYSKEKGFFNESNLPHIIKMIDYFISLDREDIQFSDILNELLTPDVKSEYENCNEFYSDELDLTYAGLNVANRIEFLKEFVDDYIDKIDEANEIENDDNDDNKTDEEDKEKESSNTETVVEI